MADIDVQRKKGPGIWPWIAGVAILALVIWGVTQMGDDRRADGGLYNDTATVAPAAETWGQDTAWQTTPGTTAPGTTPGMDPYAPGTPGTTDPAQDPATGTGTGTGTTGTVPPR